MSISFYATIDSADVPTYAVYCDATSQEIGEYVGRANAVSEMHAHSLVCASDLCRDYGAEVNEIHPDGMEPINMSNRNARDVLSVLGVSLDDVDAECGTLSAAALIERCDVALSVGFRDDGYPSVTAGRSTDCGRSAGYVAERVTQIRALAVACQSAGKSVTWA
jgi:hypothetical protein